MKYIYKNHYWLSVSDDGKFRETEMSLMHSSNTVSSSDCNLQSQILIYLSSWKSEILNESLVEGWALGNH